VKAKLFFLFLLCCLIAASRSLPAAGKSLTIIHTNDLHSHLLGHSPNRDYTPLTTGDDDTLGGFARIATVIESERVNRGNPVLVLDAGDFLMGSLFHMISREEAVELRLMKEMGYDVVTIGNHEFDIKPEGLAGVIQSAAKRGKMPAIVSSSIIFDASDDRDDELELAFKRGLVRPYTVLEREGLRIGIFGLMGNDAAGVSIFASPVKFADPMKTARRMVKILREDEKVDVVICLSHGGIDGDRDKSEDEILAREVPGIDIIVSGHTHTKLSEPIVAGDTIIVQAWSYGRAVGVLDVTVEPRGVRLADYRLIEIDDSIGGDKRIEGLIRSHIETINEKVLDEHHLEFYQEVAETDFDLREVEKESNLGNLIADSIVRAVNKREYDPGDSRSRVRFAVQSNGGIRSDLLKGRTGRIITSDLVRVVPCGIGHDDTMGYPLVTFHLHASEIKKAMEVPTTVYPAKGDNYILQFSGLKVTYNPYRVPFDRVTEIMVEDNGVYEPLDYSESNKTLYKVATNIYNATFLRVIGNFTHGILTIVPKDGNGEPIDDLNTVRVDADPTAPGVQELKDWMALVEYTRSFGDSDGDGLPEIPRRYEGVEGRYVKAPSLNPYHLLSGGNYLTWLAFSAVMLALIAMVLIVYIFLRVIKKHRYG